ncbi:excinuclease ABC subunit A [Balneicella halophila]|uniref:UvrABC system protein A n=1 Tax=Balneicella halophila TaxID=1537566 RepID=A0A7L4UP51_BALHA|nr:excinuclease ABC subunit UvrA [Balneicella halophila]PVX49843.1 excinuclease ABC subunit A [Balneicella halophila]
MQDWIEVFGAREHNLRNIDVRIPHNALTVITGLSGSGKSSLAFDTIYAEGQRRYIETFSAYARQFLGGLERPDVDKITGLSPVIAIEQKTTNKNPRSTVGTVTELYDFLRLLYARAGIAYSYKTGEPMVKQTEEQIIDMIIKDFEGKPVYLLSPIVKGRKGHYRELFEQFRKQGFLHARIDGEIVELLPAMKLDRYKTHDIELLVDKLKITNEKHDRLKSSVKTALKQGKGVMMALDKEGEQPRFYSRSLMCPTTGIAYADPAPHSFSFNSPRGACSRCNGLGRVDDIAVEKIIPNKKLSIREGGIVAVGKYKNALLFWQFEAIGKKYGFTIDDPIESLSEEALEVLLNGSQEPLKLKNTPLGSSANYMITFDGIISYIKSQNSNKTSKKAQQWVEQFVENKVCPKCKGQRLKKESLHFKVYDKNISELAQLDLGAFAEWLKELPKHLTKKQKLIATELLKEISTRLDFLLDVGLYYLALDRPSASLSGGEAQRIRLATQIGSQLVNVLYILDEPSIGLHQRDNDKLIHSLLQLRDKGNSVIVVEHDQEMMESADYIIDMGERAGRHGGKVVAKGSYKELLKYDTLTTKYLKGERYIPVPEERREGSGKNITLINCTGNNLRNVSVSIPLGKLVCVTGVSGSGKSTLINETLYPILSHHFYRAITNPMPYEKIEGIENINKVIQVNQAPIGRTPRSNPATYTNIFTDIRKIFEQLPESKIRGYKAGRFSFNVKGGRCEVCQGAGLRTIEMSFLPDVYVPCDVCHGKRYNRETLEVRYKGKSIGDVLEMTIEQAVEFFENIPKLHHKLKTLEEVGLGYITLGQSSTTLSGGEAQRVKLATELAKRDTGNTLYILDEPTTGLHFEDICILLKVIDKIMERGNTVIIIEHNLDIIKMADHIIDIGPEGGQDGGQILFEGTPEEIIKKKDSYTGFHLGKYMNGSK